MSESTALLTIPGVGTRYQQYGVPWRLHRLAARMRDYEGRTSPAIDVFRRRAKALLRRWRKYLIRDYMHSSALNKMLNESPYVMSLRLSNEGLGEQSDIFYSVAPSALTEPSQIWTTRKFGKEFYMERTFLASFDFYIPTLLESRSWLRLQTI